MIILLPTDELIVTVLTGIVDGAAFFADTISSNALVSPHNAVVSALVAGTHVLVAPPAGSTTRRAVRNVYLASNNGSAATAQLKLRRTVNNTVTTINLTGTLDAAAGFRI